MLRHWEPATDRRHESDGNFALCGRAKDSYLGRASSELEFRALDVATPIIDGGAHWIDDRLMGGVVETAVAPTELYGKSSGGLHVNVYRVAIGMPAGSHTNGRLVDA